MRSSFWLHGPKGRSKAGTKWLEMVPSEGLSGHPEPAAAEPRRRQQQVVDKLEQVVDKLQALQDECSAGITRVESWAQLAKKRRAQGQGATILSVAEEYAATKRTGAGARHRT